MIDFSKMTAVSAAVGLQNYDNNVPFSFDTPGQSIPIVSGGVYHHYSNSASFPRNLLGVQPTQNILTSVLFNVNVTDAAGSYRTGPTVSDQIIVGSAGGFPIFYVYNVTAANDANNVTFTIDIGNPSAVNAVTPPTITVSGLLFFYLAPF